MGPGGIEHDGIEILDILLGSGADEVTINTTDTGTTTIRGFGGEDDFFVREIRGHTRLLGGDDDDEFTVTDEGLLDSIDAQLLLSGEGGDDTAIVDDTADDADDTGTLTQTSLVGLDMDAEPDSPQDLFSLELSADVDAFVITISVERPAGPGIPPLELDNFSITIDAAAIDDLAALGPLPYGDYSGYAGTTVADLDEYLLAGLIQQALFPE